MKRFLKEFRVELIAVLVVLFGFFLLIEQFDIRVTIFRFASQLIGQIKSVAETIYKVVINYSQVLTLSDAIGWVIILGASFFFFYRARYRFLLSVYLPAKKCPNCEGSLRNIHRTSWDVFFQRILFTNFRRYSCPNEECQWSSIAINKLPGSKRSRIKTKVS